MAKLRDLPGWAQVALAAGAMLFSAAWAWGDLKSDLRAESIQRLNADDQHERQDQRIEKSLDELKLMLREEMDRHHPRLFPQPAPQIIDPNKP